MVYYFGGSEASPTMGCSIEISRDIYKIYWRASEARETLFSHVYGFSRYIYINTMAECRSGRKCIAVK